MIDLHRRTVVDVLETAASEHPDRRAIIDRDGQVTYGALFDRSLRVAAGLRSLGVGAGDRVVLMLDNSIDHAVAWFACSCLNAIEVPVNTASMPPQLAYVIGHCEAKVAIVEFRYVERLGSIIEQPSQLRTLVVRGDRSSTLDLPVEVSDLDVVGLETLASSQPITPEHPKPWDPLGILYTSGTTSRPKGVVVTQAQTYGRMWPFGPGTARSDDTTLVVLPLYHVIGQCRGLYNTLIVGGTAVLEPRFSASRFWDTCRYHDVTYVPLVGVMARYLLQQPPRSDDTQHTVRHVALGTTIREVEAFRKRFAISEATVSYGLTEVGGLLVGIAEPEACGKLRPDFQALLVDEADMPVPDGCVGELVVRPTEPWTVMSGYYKMPQETIDVWRNLWMHTEDLMRRRRDGTFVFVGRRSQRIRVRGENVSPEEVEAQLSSHPEVRECAVVGVNTAADEQEILAAVVLDERDVPPDELVAFLADRLPRFALPRYVTYVDALPRTDSTHRVRRSEIAEVAMKNAWDLSLHS